VGSLSICAATKAILLTFP